MKLTKLFLKITISLFLIFVLLHKIDIHHLKEIIFRIGIENFIILSMMYMLSQVISSIRWHFVIKSLDRDIPALELLRVYLIGMFANIFLPSIIGGDALKAYIISKKIGLEKSISSIFLERYNGLLALLFISLLSVLFFHNFFNYKITIAVILINIFSYISIYSLKFIQGSNKIKQFYKNITIFHKSKNFILVSSLSFLVQITVILIYYICGNMLGLKVDWIYYFAFIPIINLISFLPISFNGIGVREFSFVFFFHFAGLNKLYAISLSIEVFFVTLFCSLFGGVIYFIGRYNPKEIKGIYKNQ